MTDCFTHTKKYSYQISEIQVFSLFSLVLFPPHAKLSEVFTFPADVAEHLTRRWRLANSQGFRHVVPPSHSSDIQSAQATHILSVDFELKRMGYREKKTNTLRVTRVYHPGTTPFFWEVTLSTRETSVTGDFFWIYYHPCHLTCNHGENVVKLSTLGVPGSNSQPGKSKNYDFIRLIRHEENTTINIYVYVFSMVDLVTHWNPHPAHLWLNICSLLSSPLIHLAVRHVVVCALAG